MKIQKVKQMKQRYIFLVYGESKVGKTSLAKTLKGKTLIMSLEKGLSCLHDSTNDIDAIEIDTFEDFQKASKIIKKENYNHIIIDSLTDLSYKLYDHLKEKFPDMEKSMVLWNNYSYLMRKIIMFYRDMTDKNVFFLALNKVDKDENNKRYMMPEIYGKLASQLPRFFDCVFYMGVGDKSERYFLTYPKSNIKAGDRTGKLEEFEKPDLQGILDKIQGVKNNE